MKNYYQTLSLVDSATPDEIRRAYRILARRYHPDLNPGKDSTEKFKEISEAHETLSDPKLRKKYDREFEKAQRKKVNEKQTTVTREQFERLKKMRDGSPEESGKFGDTKPEQSWTEGPARPAAAKGTILDDLKAGARRHLESLRNNVEDKWDQLRQREDKSPVTENRILAKVSIVEVSLRVEDSIRGVKKTIEINDPEGARRVSVFIPPGSRDGSVLRLRNKNQLGEDLVLIVRLASHPFLSIKPKGLVVEVPISIKEALHGAQINVPGIEDQLLRIPAGTQSGTEFRIKEKGIALNGEQRGDLFIRVLIRIPEFADASGLKEKATEIDQYYGGSVRQGLPKSILAG